MLESSDVVAFVAATDLARARAFYTDALGLTLLSEDPFACTFSAHGTILRISRVDEIFIAPYTVLGWSVSDIAATVRTLTEAGVVFERFASMEQDELGVWDAPGGARVAWFKDPDGNTLSVTQNRPGEGTSPG
jgi:catechol 2,3-dioxygenase-like lactoylglutathione lyase family enzyme